MEDYGSCDMYFGKEIEVSEYEECLARVLVVQPHVLLEHEQVVFHVRVPTPVDNTVARLV